ncbi:MAG: hypothetical protein JNK14_20965 [Chitinophagaceae bacterium]|nr:hypothetical protein [Chitinophagaceae bacterium]
MKNFIVTLSLVLATAGTGQVFANSTPDDPRTLETFTKKFVGAENIKWSKLTDGYEKVAFTLSGTRAEAYFGSEGEFLGTVRNIFYSQLPLPVIQAVSNKFQEASVIEVKEISNSEGVSYRVILEHKDRKYSLKLNSLGDITEQQKEKIKK